MPDLVSPALPAGTLGGRQPRVVGSTVTLRPWRETDVPGLVAAYADPEIQRWHCRSLDDDEAHALVDQWRAGWLAEQSASWAVVDAADDDAVLGRAGFRELNLWDGAAEVAYWVMPTSRRRGVAVAAVTTLRRWAFDEVGFHRLELLHSVGNVASCAVAASTGFSVEGTLRRSVRHTDGWHDMHLHARLRSDRP